MDQRQFIYGFTSQVAVVGQGFTAAAFVPLLASEIDTRFQVPRNDFFFIPVPPSGTLTITELTNIAGATLGFPLTTGPLYNFRGAGRFAIATTGATAVLNFLKGLSANTATFAIGT